MNKLLLIALAVLFPCFAPAQSIKMGEISQNEIDLREVAYEPGAAAVVLAASGDSRFFGGIFETTYFYRIKILTDAGKNFGTVKIGYYRGNTGVESLSNVKAQAINFVNGQRTVTSLGKGEQFDVDLGNGWRELRLSFPNVQVGSILEYTFRKGDKNMEFLEGWNFQNSIPTLYSKYRITMIPQLEYKMIGQGQHFTTKARVSSENGSYSWELRDLFSLKEEPFMKNYRDYAERVEFQLFRYQSAGSGSDGYQSGAHDRGEFVEFLNTWEKLGDGILDAYTRNGFYRTSPIEREFLSLDLSSGTQFEKAKKAYYYIRNNFTAKGMDKIFPNQTLNQLLKSRNGSPGELILAYMGILKAQGITCEPVLIGSKGYGRSELVQFPFLNQFDKILLLAELDGKQQFIDLSDPLAPFGYVDLEKHVSGGFLLKKGSSKLIAVDIRHSSNNMFFSNVAINPESGALVMDYSVRNYFYSGLKMSHTLSELEKSNKRAEELFKGSEEIFQIENVKTENLLEEKNYFNTSFQLVWPDASGQDRLVFNPLRVSSFAQNPFTQEYRVFPVDFEYPFSETYTANIQLPEGYVVDDFPVNESLTIPGAPISFQYNVEHLGAVLKVSAKLEIKTSLIPVKSYSDLKFFMESVASKLVSPVILKKVERAP